MLKWVVPSPAPPPPPPVPPPRFRPRPPLLPLPRLPSFKPRHAPASLPPPLPPRGEFTPPLLSPPLLSSSLSLSVSSSLCSAPSVDKMEADDRLKANVNVVSLSVGQLVNIQPDADQEASQSPVHCGNCSAALSCLTSLPRNVSQNEFHLFINFSVFPFRHFSLTVVFIVLKAESLLLLLLVQMWVCDFCGSVNGVHVDVTGTCTGQCTAEHSDDLYLLSQSDDDYQNLEDSLVVFCVDISGSMSVTTEVCVCVCLCLCVCVCVCACVQNNNSTTQHWIFTQLSLSNFLGVFLQKINIWRWWVKGQRSRWTNIFQDIPNNRETIFCSRYH